MRKCSPYLAIYFFGVYSREVAPPLSPVYQSVAAFLEVWQRTGSPLHHDVLLDAKPNQLLHELVPLQNVPVTVEDVLLCALDSLLMKCVNLYLRLQWKKKLNIILSYTDGGKGA